MQQSNVEVISPKEKSKPKIKWALPKPDVRPELIGVLHLRSTICVYQPFRIDADFGLGWRNVDLGGWRFLNRLMEMLNRERLSSIFVEISWRWSMDVLNRPMEMLNRGWLSPISVESTGDDRWRWRILDFSKRFSKRFWEKKRRGMRMSEIFVIFEF